MTSLRHNPESDRPDGPELAEAPVRSTEDLALDAARESILAVGWKRSTLTDIARRAGVSRMTLYRRWPEMNALLADLMTREWTGLLRLGSAKENRREQLVEDVVATVAAVRDNELFARIIELDPELLLPYLLERPGRSQELVLEFLTAAVAAAQAAGEIRPGDPGTLARAVVLAAHGFTLSAHTMAVDPGAFDAELGHLVESYLRP